MSGRWRILVIAVGVVLTLGAAVAFFSGWFSSSRVPGEDRPDSQYAVADAPASRLRPAAVDIGIGAPDAPEEDRVNVGFNASWSSDSELVAVVGGRTDDPTPGLWVGKGLDSALERIADQVTYASFSPVGKSIVMSVLEGDYSRSVKVIPAEGGQASLVAQNAAGPAWSPDGGRIAYLAGAPDGSRWDLAVRDRPPADGSETDRPVIIADDVAAVRPVVSADGASVYYADNEKGGLWSAAVTGEGDPVQVEPDQIRERIDELSMSADGESLAFLDVSQPASQGAAGLSEPARGIARVYTKSTGGVSSPFGERVVSHPKLSADGKRLWAGTEGGLLVADTETGSLGFVPVGRRRAYLPAPSPDGRSVIAISPSSDFAAALLAVPLGVFSSDETYLVVAEQLPATADADKALERYYVMESPSADATGSDVFLPGYPVALSSNVFPELPANKVVISTGRFDLRDDADAQAERLRSAGVTATVEPVR